MDKDRRHQLDLLNLQITAGANALNTQSQLGIGVAQAQGGGAIHHHAAPAQAPTLAAHLVPELPKYCRNGHPTRPGHPFDIDQHSRQVELHFEALVLQLDGQTVGREQERWIKRPIRQNPSLQRAVTFHSCPIVLFEVEPSGAKPFCSGDKNVQLRLQLRQRTYRQRLETFHAALERSND